MRTRFLALSVRALAPAGLALMSAAAPGQTYRWVDEQGQTHYTQVAPTGRTYDLIGAAPPPAQAPNQDTLNESLAEAIKATPEQEKAAAAAAQQEAQRQADCRAALERIAYLDARTPRRLATTDPATGQVSRMSDQEFTRLRTLEQEKAAKNCD